MPRMKKLLLASVFAFAVCGGAFAEDAEKVIKGEDTYYGIEGEEGMYINQDGEVMTGRQVDEVEKIYSENDG